MPIWLPSWVVQFVVGALVAAGIFSGGYVRGLCLNSILAIVIFVTNYQQQHQHGMLGG